MHVIPFVTLSLEGLVYSRCFAPRLTFSNLNVAIAYLLWYAFLSLGSGVDFYPYLLWNKEPMTAFGISVVLLLLSAYLLHGLIRISKWRLSVAAKQR